MLGLTLMLLVGMIYVTGRCFSRKSLIANFLSVHCLEPFELAGGTSQPIQSILAKVERGLCAPTINDAAVFIESIVERYLQADKNSFPSIFHTFPVGRIPWLQRHDDILNGIRFQAVRFVTRLLLTKETLRNTLRKEFPCNINYFVHVRCGEFARVRKSQFEFAIVSNRVGSHHAGHVWALGDVESI